MKCGHCGEPFIGSSVTQQLLDQGELLKKQADELRELALKDELTGLYNRRGFFALADQHLLHARRAGEHALLCYFDIDGLKAVNDAQGHGAGDTLIREAALALRRTFRAPDIIARIGGDEFVVLAIETAHAQAIIRRLAIELTSSGVRFSCGMVPFDPMSSDTIEIMINRADQDMYAQKRERKAG